MIIIMGGPDKAGKTTLVKHLKEYFSAIECKGTVLEPETLSAITESYIDMFERNTDTNFICDRFNLIDDRVYSPIIENRPAAYTKEEIEDFEKRLLKLKTIFISVTADYDTIVERYEKANGDPYTSLACIKDLQKQYNKIREETLLPSVEVDTTKRDVFYTVVNLIQAIDEVSIIGCDNSENC